LVESGPPIPGIAEHAESVAPHNANITPRILLPEIASSRIRRNTLIAQYAAVRIAPAVENPALFHPSLAVPFCQTGHEYLKPRKPSRDGGAD
jgi:hypothetical protein